MNNKITKIFAVVLCLSLIMTGISGFAAEQSAKVDRSKEIGILSQLGVLDVTAENAVLTKQTVINGLNSIMGNSAPQMVYFENHEPTDALNYGQAVMVLVDALGYSHYVELLGYDPSSVESYINTAKRIKLVRGAGKSASASVTIGEWSELLFEALTKIPLMRPMLMRETIVYDIDDDSTMLDEYMGIKTYDGVIKGVDSVSVIANDGDGKNRIRLGNKWYNYSIDEDMFKYLGYFVKGYVNTDKNELCAIWIDDKKNEVVSVNAEDVKKASSKTSISYYDKNDKTKTLKISTEADFIYNRELVTDFNASDLNIEDCDYTFIDNDNNGKVEVIIAEKFTSFAVGSRQVAEKRILDTNGTVTELEKFFDDGGKLCDENGAEMSFESLQSYDTVSYLKARSGKMTYMAAVDNKIEATYNGNRDDGKYVKLNGVEYKTTKDYRSGTILDTVKPGDVVMAFIDIKGSVADMRYVSKGEKTAYIMQASPGVLDTVTVKMLDEDNGVGVYEISGTIELDGAKISAADLLSQPVFLKKGAFVPQLIKYKQNKDGSIRAIDTAKNMNKLGSRGNDEFTLNYDGTLTILTYKPNARVKSLNIAGSKYPLSELSKLFIITTDSDGNFRDDECLVQNANGLIANQNSSLKLYNVNDNYEPEYVVWTTSWDYGEWVDAWGPVYMVDEVSETLDEFGNPVYQIKYIDNEGNGAFINATEGDLVSPGDNETFGWSSSWSPDHNDWIVKLKDLPKGTIFTASRSAKGVIAFAAHHIPKDSNTFFEKISGSSSDYGISETLFYGGYSMCYGTVLRKTDTGYIINCHEPTADEAAAGAVYPMPEWNRHIPMIPSQAVVIYDSESKTVYRDTASNIVPGDKIFMKRDQTTYNGIYIYR